MSPATIALDAVLQADREPAAAMHNRPAAFEKQASPRLAARHDRWPLALIEDEYRQFRLLNFALSSDAALRAISPPECCRPAFEQDHRPGQLQAGD
jgi:hypothetical protein